MNWIWGEKKQEKTKVDFVAKTHRRDLVNRTIKVHLELKLEYPGKMDIIQAIRDTKTIFDLPPGIVMSDAHLVHVEILGEPS
jgi:hypothetical protein